MYIFGKFHSGKVLVIFNVAVTAWTMNEIFDRPTTAFLNPFFQRPKIVKKPYLQEQL